MGCVSSLRAIVPLSALSLFGPMVSQLTSHQRVEADKHRSIMREQEIMQFLSYISFCMGPQY